MVEICKLFLTDSRSGDNDDKTINRDRMEVNFSKEIFAIVQIKQKMWWPLQRKP